MLAVDDQRQNLRLLEAVLTPRGYRVITAASGEEAVELLSQEIPDLVLLDIVMPGMDGYEVCRRIRDDPGDGVPPGGHDHGQRGAGEDLLHRGGC